MKLEDKFGISEKDLRGRAWVILRPCTGELERMCLEHEPILAPQAAVALGKIGSPTSVEPLCELLQDESMASEAVLALSRIDAPGIVDRLLEVLRATTPPVMSAIAGVLGRYETREVVDNLMSLARSTHENVRNAALDSLAELGNPRSRDLLVSIIGDDNTDTVVRAVKAYSAIGIFDVDEALEHLLPVYETTSDARVKASIITAFHGCFSDKLLAVLKGACKDSNPRVRANAVEVIGAMDLKPDRKIRLLKPIIQEGENNRVLANVAIALGGIDTDTSLHVLSRLLNSTEKWERASAVYAARFVKNVRVASWLTTLFTSEDDPDVLRNVLESLAHFDSDEVSSCFVKALEHANPLVRSGAARSLGRINDPSLQEHLVSVLGKEQDSNVICEILTSLGVLADASRINLIAGYLQHTDIRVQANAIEALETIGTIEVVPFVEPFLNSSDNRVKANAAVALWAQGSLDVVSALREMLNHLNLKQRSSAVYAVGELGEALRNLSSSYERYFMLISALKQEEFGGIEISRPAVSSERGVSAAAKAEKGESGEVDDVAYCDEEEFLFSEIEEYFSLLSKRKVKDALKFLDRCLEKHPDNSLLLYLRADGFRLKKKRDRACEGFRSVTQMLGGDEGFVNAYIHLANIFSKSKDMPQSLEAYFLACRNQMKIMEREIDLGLDMIERNDINEASLLLKNIISRVPLNSRIHYAAGRSFLKGKMNERAFAHLKRAYLISPNNGEVLLSLAFACYKTGRYREVRGLAKKLRNLFGSDSPMVAKANELVKAMNKAGV